MADQTSRIVAELERSECRELHLFSKLTWNFGIITQGPVSIVVKLYQFHIVTVIELRSVYLTTLSFVL